MATVGELIDTLTKLGKKIGMDAQVVQQKDAEGNGYSPLAGADIAFYEATTTWYGECYDPSDEDTPADLPKVVVVWPVN